MNSARPASTRATASVVSKLVADAGYPRSTVEPGGRSGIPTPVTTGYHTCQHGHAVYVYWRGPAPDTERRRHLDQIGTTLARHGYLAEPGDIGHGVPVLRVTRPTEGRHAPGRSHAG